ncbi:hypothetical protein FB562_2208 [Homoserinimonas aerilata]|uniref:Helix-turn-helix protein n=1 Tax=Homoserinimonas aerilata TaxID=1162970 RepID=A0A542YFE5_9MICO|nr:hypothetical protein [Homoserinimonas aerilata]TQL46684.1 hypothetical protein FB562_2208 [Homoserinimonas aerilata]
MAKLTDEQRDQILALHAQGLARNEIARQTGVSTGSVTNVCKDNDRAFDRSATKDAQAARSVDLAEARLNLAQRLNVAANDMLDMLDKPFTVFNFGGKDNTFASEELDTVPVEARRTIITSTAIVFDKISRIVEKDNGGLDQAVGVLDQIAAGFRVAADRYRGTEGSDIAASDSEQS